jgi:MFS superfamily sulfate permease-like transporter
VVHSPSEGSDRRVAPTAPVEPEPEPGSWFDDLRAGVVVWLVALPLCLGIALASGAPLVSGLITGIIGGLVVSWLGGSALLVSGPAAGLAAIVLAAIAELGSFSALLATTVVAGGIQVILGLARAGRLANLVPSSVVTGMLAGIGVLLILQQLPHAIGVDGPEAHGLALLLTPILVLPHALPGPAMVAALSLAVLFLWERPAMRTVRGRLPAALVAVGSGVALSELLSVVAPQWAVSPEHRVNLPDLSLGQLGSVIVTPDWSVLATTAGWRIAVTLALVASLETLLSMQATDRMDPLKRRSDGNRELLGQGVGNTLSGLVGGLPMTGVIVRSAANVNAGGRTWKSALYHGILLVGTVFTVPFLLERIPLAALAAILLFTGWKLAHPSRFTAGFRIGKNYGVPLAVTVFAIVATDLLIGVGIGLMTGVVFAVVNAARHGLDVVHEDGDERLAVRLELAESVTFVHKIRLQDEFDKVPDGAEVTVDGTRAKWIDHDVLEMLHGLAEVARSRDIRVQLVDIPAPLEGASH